VVEEASEAAVDEAADTSSSSSSNKHSRRRTRPPMHPRVLRTPVAQVLITEAEAVVGIVATILTRGEAVRYRLARSRVGVVTSHMAVSIKSSIADGHLS
jgi:hypothetical protein